MFLRLYDATSPYKNLVKKWKNELVPACDSEANFFHGKYGWVGPMCASHSAEGLASIPL
jgi:hypothetical protein